MLCEKIQSELPPDGSAVLPKVEPNQKPPEETGISAEDQKKIGELLLQRQSHPKGSPEYNRLTNAVQFRRHRQKMYARSRAWQAAHRSVMAKRNREWRKKNPEKTKAAEMRNLKRRTDWAKANPEKRREISLRYYYNHRPAPKPKKPLSQTPMNVYRRSERKTNIQFMLKDRLRATMNRAFRRQWIKKPTRTEALLGCTIDEAKRHIESQFEPGMSWANRTSFVIDHYLPIAAFDLRDPEEVKFAFGYLNLRPITQRENAIKSDAVLTTMPSWLPPHIQARIVSRSRTS